MSTALGNYTVPYFSKWGRTSEGDKVPVFTSTLSIVNGRKVYSTPVRMPGVVGTVSPKLDADLDVTDGAGRRREGHIEVTTQTRLPVDDEATNTPSAWVKYKGYWYFLKEQDDWDAAGAYVYRGTRDRRMSNV